MMATSSQHGISNLGVNMSYFEDVKVFYILDINVEFSMLLG